MSRLFWLVSWLCTSGGQDQGVGQLGSYLRSCRLLAESSLCGCKDWGSCLSAGCHLGAIFSLCWLLSSSPLWPRISELSAVHAAFCLWESLTSPSARSKLVSPLYLSDLPISQGGTLSFWMPPLSWLVLRAPPSVNGVLLLVWSGSPSSLTLPAFSGRSSWCQRCQSSSLSTASEFLSTVLVCSARTPQHIPMKIYTSLTCDTNTGLPGTSLVAQWLRIRLPTQGTQVWPLVLENPTCHGATKPLVGNNRSQGYTEQAESGPHSP